MGNQNCLIWVFLDWNSKKLLHCSTLHQHPQIFLNIKFQPKIKIYKFGTKTTLINWVFSGEITKTYVVYEISFLEFVNMQSFIQKRRNFKLGTKNTYISVFLG